MRDVLASRSHRSYDLAVRLVCESVQAFTCAYEQGLMGTFYCLYAEHIFLMTVASDMLGMQTYDGELQCSSAFPLEKLSVCGGILCHWTLVNDPYVMHARAKQVDPDGKIDFYGDVVSSVADFVGKAIDLDATARIKSGKFM